jgi:hypothetical protein
LAVFSPPDNRVLGRPPSADLQNCAGLRHGPARSHVDRVDVECRGPGRGCVGAGRTEVGESGRLGRRALWAIGGQTSQSGPAPPVPKLGRAPVLKHAVRPISA